MHFRIEYRGLFLWVRRFAISLCVFLFWQSGLSVSAKGEPRLYSLSAALLDGESGRVLYEKEGDEKRPMASTTKILTAILVLENCDLEEEAKVSGYASSMPKVKLYARTGEAYRVKDLLYSMLLESHNDSAQILAEHMGAKWCLEGEDAGKAFAKRMNQKAREIGCRDAWFITPNGLDATETFLATGEVKTHEITARDLALILRYCILQSEKREQFLEIARTESYSFTANGRRFLCVNKNALLQMYPGAIAGKTGFTGNAGYCYVGAVKVEGKTFVVALLGCGWPNHRQYKWADVRSLLNYGNENYEEHSLGEYLLPLEKLPKLMVEGGDREQIECVINTERETLAKETFLVHTEEEIEVQVDIFPKVTAPVVKGQKVGEIRYQIGNYLLGTEEVVASVNVLRKDYLWYLERVWKIFAKKSNSYYASCFFYVILPRILIMGVFGFVFIKVKTPIIN